mmetsp:Transcript_48715/g.112907  ORF Transcript_48715/g.112907 Transcript_48715/m.112907 type:complete len:140 (+) Transcript_48715:86-505(+)
MRRTLAIGDAQSERQRLLQHLTLTLLLRRRLVPSTAKRPAPSTEAARRVRIKGRGGGLLPGAGLVQAAAKEVQPRSLPKAVATEGLQFHGNKATSMPVRAGAKAKLRVPPTRSFGPNQKSSRRSLHVQGAVARAGSDSD